MRYLLQLLIPALIFVAVVYVLTRARRGSTSEPDRPAERTSDTGPFIVILAISALVALGTGYLLMSFLN
ncbi:MAG: hypothetical protein RIC56_12630 [Pseudomonadales bacterium]